MNVKVSPRRTQEERREESRRKLIEAAMRLLSERGYAGTTMVEIGRKAGVSHGLVTYHFGTKKDCINAVLEDIRNKTMEGNKTITKGLRGLAALDKMCESYLRGASRRHSNAKTVYVAIAESISATPDLTKLTAKNDEVARGTVVKVLREAIDDGEIDANTDVEVQSVLVLALLRGVTQQRMVKRSRVDLDRVIPQTLAMVRASLTV
ncbi:MAG: TetR/AcrR family transcriptional regulator [Pseudomonadota bacterium]